MRSILCVLVLVVGVASASADEKADRERRVRVALALAAAGEGDGPAADCGRCRSDVEGARRDALAGGKPVVLFVGGCPGVGDSAAVERAGGIPAKTDSYKDGDHPDDQRRVVILEPKADRSGFVRVDLPATVTPVELEQKVKASVPAPAPAPAAGKLNWHF